MSKNKEPNIENEAAESEVKAESGESAEALKARCLEAEAALEKAKAEAAEINDRYLRLAAEYDNYRKRTQKERDSLYNDAFADAIVAFLPVVDNLDRAVEYATGDSELAKGVQMLKKQTTDTLAKMRVEEILSDGQPFNPEVHNAIMHEDDENSPENTVSVTLQKGYRLGDKVIRYALVKVVN